MKTTNRHRILLIAILILSSGLLQAKSIDTVSIHFSFNDVVVSETSKRYIDSLVKEKILIPGGKLTILGYADYVGDNKYNYALSQSRANNVMEYLISSGFGKSDVKVCVGKGKIERMSTKNEGYARDRKVQIIMEKLPEADRVEKNGESISFVSLTDITNATENDVIPLDNILFETGSYEIVKSSLHDLILLVKFLKTNPSVAVQIEGHICCGGWGGVDHRIRTPE
jgi:outer membrane protein OmpA-like peptidoglycan-associated protein